MADNCSEQNYETMHFKPTSPSTVLVSPSCMTFGMHWVHVY